MLIHHSENPRAIKNYATSTLPMLYKWNNIAWIRAHLFTTQFIKYFKPTVGTHCSEQKDSFQNITAIDNAPGYTRALMETCNEINIVLQTANTASILYTMDQGVISTFKSYYLRNAFHKVIAAIDSDSSEASRQSKLKFLKRTHHSRRH